MKVALIYPPFYHKKFNENLPTVDDEFGLFPHLGFGWVAACIKMAGHAVKLFDAAASKCSYEAVLAQVKAYNPDLLGFAAHSTQTFRDMLQWAQYFKRDTGLPIVVGGHEAKIYPVEVMEHPCFDYLCAGESLTFIEPFLTAFGRGSGYNHVPDLYFRAYNGRLLTTFDAPHVPFRDHPMPDRSIFPNHLYYSHVSQRQNFTIGMSEVGCPYPCSFCSIRRTGFEARTPVQVADEIQHCIETHGIHEIDWFDPIMLFDRRRAIAMAHEIKRRNLDIIWSTRCRVDSLTFRQRDGKLDEELIREIAESGCRRLFFGIESGDDTVLKNVHKGINFKSTKRILDCCQAHGIRPLGFFMIGNPGETRESAERTIRFAKALPLEYAQFTLTMIKPHSELEQEYVVEATGVDYWREYIRGTVEEQLLPTPWTKLTRAEIERLARRAYLKFYLRPRYMWRMIRRLESTSEFLRYGRVAFQLMARPLRPLKIGKSPVLARYARFALAFADGALAAANHGARHPVSSFGGGVRGAWRFAMYEMSRLATDKDMGAPGGADDAEIMASAGNKAVRRIEDAHVVDRYVPLSVGALQNQKRVVVGGGNGAHRVVHPNPVASA
jgi:anaerobic magnesium-protoporphyrin IX monomethyl ester cyclase